MKTSNEKDVDLLMGCIMLLDDLPRMFACFGCFCAVAGALLAAAVRVAFEALR